MIIPALDLIDGKIVRLYQGDYKQITTYGDDPCKQLDHYHNNGAHWVHLVDLSAARDPSHRQLSHFKSLIKYTDAHIQIGGGIRKEKDLCELLDMGVKRVVIGSIALKEPQTVKKWIAHYGAQHIVLALDVHINQNNKPTIAVSGWQERSNVTPEQLLNEYLQESELKHVLCTDISRDGTLNGSNVALYQQLCKTYPSIEFQSSGGIGSLDDITALKNTGVTGVIVGRALLEGKFTLKEAITCWQNE